MAFSMLRKPMDYDKFLDEYRATLQLQINNNNRVYNAVSQANQGIQIPEQPPDMRSLSEKIGDIQNLKNQLSVQLRQITDGSNADMIVNRLNDDELARAVQYFQTLAQKLKSSYALGVPADVFIQALQNYSDVQDESAGIDMGLQGLQRQSDKILLSLKNIQDHGLKPDSVKKLLKFGSVRKVVSPAQKITLDELEKIMLSLADLQRIASLPSDQKSELEQKLTEIYPKLPTQQQFDDLFNFMQTISDPVQQQQEFNRIVGTMSGLTEADAEVLREYKGVKKRGELRIKSPSGKTFKFDPNAPPIVALTKEELKKQRAEKRAAKAAAAKAAATTSVSPPSSPPQQGKGMRGRGMVMLSEPSEIVEKPKTKKAIRISGKIEKPIEFVPFGKYAIHKYDLNSCILKLRSKSNNTIPTIPPQKISKSIADILKQVVIGGTPSFEAIAGLDEHDKELLHKIVRLSRVELSVPTPDLTKTQQDNHRFQLLRGQLLAGNSSQEIIKELKALLLKFIANGSIPKAQANAVLYELMVISK
jgi:hypothetical protein